MMILQLTEDGMPRDWISWQDAVTAQCKGIVAWSLGEHEFVYHGGKSRMTGETSIVTVPSIMAIKNKYKAKNRTPVLTNKNLFRRDLHLCAYCGKVFSDTHLTRDHIIATSKGGDNTWMNCVTACKPCNNLKGDRSLEKLNWELLYVPYVPDRAEHLLLANRSILADQMEFLLAYIPKHSRAHQLM